MSVLPLFVAGILSSLKVGTLALVKLDLHNGRELAVRFEDAKSKLYELSNVFFAVEIGQRHVMVSGGCSASFNVPVESGIVRLKGDHKLGHLTVALESPEAPFGFQGTGGAPAQDHAAALPSLDAA